MCVVIVHQADREWWDVWVTRLWVYSHSFADPFITLHITSFTHSYSLTALCIMHHVMPRTLGVIYIYILMTLYMYYPGYDVMMGARCTMLLWHMERLCMIYMPYISYMYFAHCMSFPSLSTNDHTYTLPETNSKLMYFKLIVVSAILSCTPLLLNGAYLQQLCSWLSVTREC